MGMTTLRFSAHIFGGLTDPGTQHPRCLREPNHYCDFPNTFPRPLNRSSVMDDAACLHRTWSMNFSQEVFQIFLFDKGILENSVEFPSRVSEQLRKRLEETGDLAFNYVEFSSLDLLPRILAQIAYSFLHSYLQTLHYYLSKNASSSAVWEHPKYERSEVTRNGIANTFLNRDKLSFSVNEFILGFTQFLG